MRVRWLSCTLVSLVVVACGARDDEAARPAGIDSAIAEYQAEEAVVEPTPLVLQGDTLQGSFNYRCVDGTPVHAAYWVGAGARVVLAMTDTNMVLPQVEAASGAKYQVAQPPVGWWITGDTARFSWQGRDLRCGRDDTVEF
jgi:membrane-bound inhibitor of C-type lysozyme